jgi:hypothetical protein
MEVGLSGSCGSFGLPISQPKERDKPDKPVLVSANKIDQIDQTHEINQFRFAGLDHNPFCARNPTPAVSELKDASLTPGLGNGFFADAGPVIKPMVYKC